MSIPPANTSSKAGSLRPEISSDDLRLLIVDDHAVVREGLEAMLVMALAPVRIASASTGAGALQICSSFKPHVILLDVRMPGGDGFEFLELLQNACPNTRILLLSASATPAEVSLARRKGAAGYVSKSMEGAEVVRAIRKILRGGTCFTTEEPVGDALTGTGLSARELDVLRHLGRGLSNQELGRVLGISETTIKAHLRSVFVKLEASNRAEAVARAYQLGLLVIEAEPVEK